MLIKIWSTNTEVHWWRKRERVGKIANIMHMHWHWETDNGRWRNFARSLIPLSWSSYFKTFTQCIVRHSYPRSDNYRERSSEGRRRSLMESTGEVAESDVKTSRGKFRETPTSKRNDRSSKRKKIEITRPLRVYVYRYDASLCKPTRKHEWTFTPQTFPPYRSMRMREISLFENLDWNRDERGQNCTRSFLRVQWIKKVNISS